MTISSFIETAALHSASNATRIDTLQSTTRRLYNIGSA